MFFSRRLAAVVLAVFVWVVAQPHRLALGGDDVVILRSGTPVFAAFEHTVDSDSVKEGDTIHLRVIRPVLSDGFVTIRPGETVAAKVSEVKDAGGWGKRGTLTVRVESTTSIDGQPVYLSATQRREGEGKGGTAAAVGIGGVLFCLPAALLGFAIKGEEGQFPAGYEVKAYVDQDYTINLAAAERLTPALARNRQIERERQSQNVDARVPPPPRKEKRKKAVEGRATASKVTGTCFAASPDGGLLTAYHLVKDAKFIRVHLADGTVTGAKLQTFNAKKDLAVLHIAPRTPDYLSLASSGSIRGGERVFTMGYPAVGIIGQEPKLTKGSVSGFWGNASKGYLLRISVPIQRGNSGGPLVNKRGEVVGIVTSTAAVRDSFGVKGALPKNANWAVRGDYARRFFGVPAAERSAKNLNDAIERVRQAICLVEAGFASSTRLPKPAAKKGHDGISPEAEPAFEE